MLTSPFGNCTLMAPLYWHCSRYRSRLLNMVWRGDSLNLRTHRRACWRAVPGVGRTGGGGDTCCSADQARSRRGTLPAGRHPELRHRLRRHHRRRWPAVISSRLSGHSAAGGVRKIEIVVLCGPAPSCRMAVNAEIAGERRPLAGMRALQVFGVSRRQKTTKGS